MDVPGATFTRVIGLNAQGDVCGGTQVNGVRLAFAASRQADFTDLRRSPTQARCSRNAVGSMRSGQMVGVYQSADTRSHAFVKDGSEFISIDVPGAIDTRASGIDPRGQIVGRYTSPDGVIHGFFRAATGRSSRSTGPEQPRLKPQGSRPRVKSRASTERPTEDFTATSCRRTGSRRSTFRALCIRGPQLEACG